MTRTPKTEVCPSAFETPRPPNRCSRAERVIAFVHRFCLVPEGKLVGQPMVLDEFQKDFIRAVYDNPHGTRRAIASYARKNGKTGLIAGLLLAHLVGPEAKLNSQIVSGAMSRDQAGLVFSLACKMIQLSPTLSELVKITPSGKRLRGLPQNVEFRALAADGRTTHGLSPVLIIGDEWGQVKGPQSDFIDALLTSQGAHDNPLQIVISTQAASDADWLSLEIDQALRGDDPTLVCHLHAAPADCELLDEDAWKAANPALGTFRSRVDLEQQLREAVNMPSKEATVRNLLLNQRISTENPFISPSMWKANKGAAFETPPSDIPLFGGLDLSAKLDLTAFVLVGQIDGVWHVWVWTWTPKATMHERAKRDRAPYDAWVKQGLMRTTPGASVDYSFIAAELAQICNGLNVQGIAFDRWNMAHLKKELAAVEFDMELVDWGQGYASMSPALAFLEGELVNHRVAHGMHPVLTMAAANAVVVQDAAGNRKLDKSSKTRRIDPLQALAMAMGLAARTEADSGVWEMDYA